MLITLLNRTEAKMRLLLFTTCLTVFVSLGLLTGCSVSYSFGKSSDAISASLDSISASSGSISDSSSKDDKAAKVAAKMFIEDVAAATVNFISNQDNSELFQQAISSIAKNHGIVDWEQERITYIAMGRGLKQAGVDEQTISNFPYFRIVANSSFYSYVLAGYHQSS